MTPFHLLHPRAKVGLVNDFRVWRVGSSVGWDCTCKDIADETGLTLTTVQTICSRRGWDLQQRENYGDVSRSAIDHLMRTESAGRRGRA